MTSLSQELRRRRQHADKRVIPFSLTTADLKKLKAEKFCYWCNHVLTNVGIWGFTIDRIDSSLGYSSDNVVAACDRCNQRRNKEEVNLIKKPSAHIGHDGMIIDGLEEDYILNQIIETKIKLFASVGVGSLFWQPGKNRFYVVGTTHPGVNQTIDYTEDGFGVGFTKAIKIFNGLKIDRKERS